MSLMQPLPLFFLCLCICIVHSGALESVLTDCQPAEAASFERAVRAGQWACALSSIQHFQAAHKHSVSKASSSSSSGDISNSDGPTRNALLALKAKLDLAKRHMDTEVAALHAAIAAAMPGATRVTITPAFEWCQSASHIYINVKFAHKLDAPATLNVETEAVELEEGRVRLAAASTKGAQQGRGRAIWCAYRCASACRVCVIYV